MLPHMDYPIAIEGIVVKGFGRGSKQLGFPTANFDQKAVETLKILNGVYYGIARVNNGSVEDMVMSVGWNPQFQNKEKSIEVHILKKYEQDFYGCKLRVLALGYIRDMDKFESLEKLIEAINNDIIIAKSQLQKPELLKYKSDPQLLQNLHFYSDNNTANNYNSKPF